MPFSLKSAPGQVSHLCQDTAGSEMTEEVRTGVAGRIVPLTCPSVACPRLRQAMTRIAAQKAPQLERRRRHFKAQGKAAWALGLAAFKLVPFSTEANLALLVALLELAAWVALVPKMRPPAKASGEF